MNILIDIGHPAHVHMFHPFAVEMQKRGHKVLFTCRDKEFEVKLLTKYGLDFINFGKKSKSTIGKVFDLIKFDYKEWSVARKFKPDVFLSHGSITASQVAWLMRKPSIAFEDTFNMEQIRLWEPFVSVILTSNYEHPLKSKKVLKYEGYNELLYLHPNRFTPDKRVLDDLGLKEGDKYVIVRFVSWNATHDRGHHGISLENKVSAINKFSKFAKIFISSEAELPEELKEFKFPLPPERMHDAMAFASLIFGESATMVTEGAVLGVPGVYLDNTGRFYTRDIQEKYGMCFNYTESEDDQIKAIEKGVEILSNNIDFTTAHNKMMSEKIDVTGWLCEYIEKL